MAKSATTQLEMRFGEPFAAHFAGGRIVHGWSEIPDVRPWVVTTLSRSVFNAYASFDYWRDAKAFWIDGMQKWLHGDMCLVSDDLDSGIFIFYEFQSHPDHLQFLGKLHTTCRLYKGVFKAFKKFLRETARDLGG